MKRVIRYTSKVMIGEKTYLKEIKSKCPHCNYMNSDLETYMIYNPPSQKFVGDFVMSEIENEMGFLNCFSVCSNCEKEYFMKVGIHKSILTSMVIVEKDENRN